MALTTIPNDTSNLERKTSRDIRCENCGQRRTIDGYDEPTVASCISEDCNYFFIIPEYPFQNNEIKHVEGLETAREELQKLK